MQEILYKFEKNNLIKLPQNIVGQLYLPFLHKSAQQLKEAHFSDRKTLNSSLMSLLQVQVRKRCHLVLVPEIIEVEG